MGSIADVSTDTSPGHLTVKNLYIFWKKLAWQDARAGPLHRA